MDVSKAIESACSPHSAHACAMSGPYRDPTSIWSLSSQRRNRGTVLCAYCARLTTYGAHADRLVHPEWMRPTILHARVVRRRRSPQWGCWLSTGTSVSYRWGVFSIAFLLEKMSPKEDNYMKREVGRTPLTFVSQSAPFCSRSLHPLAALFCILYPLDDPWMQCDRSVLA